MTLFAVPTVIGCGVGRDACRVDDAMHVRLAECATERLGGALGGRGKEVAEVWGTRNKFFPANRKNRRPGQVSLFPFLSPHQAYVSTRLVIGRSMRIGAKYNIRD